MGGAAHYLIKQEVNKVLIRDEAPQVHLQVVTVNLDLLKPIAAKCAQPDTLQECLQTDFDNSCHHRDLERVVKGVSGTFLGKVDRTHRILEHTLLNSTELKMSILSENNLCILLRRLVSIGALS